MNRRSFFVNLMSLAGLAAVSSWSSNVLAERKRGGAAPAAGAGETPLVDPKSATAKAVGYAENKSDIKEASLKVERQGVAFEKQNCKACGFYSNPKSQGGGEVGNCQIFSGQVVKSGAWCSSWNKKA